MAVESSFMRTLAILKASFLRPDTWQTSQSCDLLLISGDSDRGESIGGRAYDRYLNSIGEIAESTGLTVKYLALPHSVLSGDRSIGSPLSMNRLALLDAVTARMPGSLRVRPWSRKFVCILQRTRPRAIFVIGAPEELCLAARELQIPIVEVLHAHGYVDYDSLGAWRSREDPKLPTHVLSFDSVSTASFRELRSRGVKVLEARDPWWTRFDGDSRSALPEEWTTPIGGRGVHGTVVLYTMQWNPFQQDRSHVLGGGSWGPLPEPVIQAMLESHTEIFWRIRVHPVLMRTPIRRSIEKSLASLAKVSRNMEWQQTSSVPIFTALEGCSAHITMSSTSAYECATRGIPSLVLDPRYGVSGEFCDWFADLEGHMLVQRLSREFDSSDILVWIREQVGRESLPPPPYEAPEVSDLLGGLLGNSAC